MGTFLLSLFVLLLASTSSAAASMPPGDRLVVAGVVQDLYGQGIKGVELEVRVDGRPHRPEGKVSPEITGSRGNFRAEILLPAGTLPGARVVLTGNKPGWRPLPVTPVQVAANGTDTAGNRIFLAAPVFALSRQATPAAWIAAGIFLVFLAIIALNLMDRTLTAALGAALVLFISYTAGALDKAYFILSGADALGAIDLNVIILLFGMMVIVGVLKRTGVFHWLTYRSYALARGRVSWLAAILMVITAVASAFLDNVTTMLLVIPVTIELALTLKVKPAALLLPEVFASNVGGTATLIGDPPNILIGSYAGLTFTDFGRHLTGILALCLAVTLIYYLLRYRKSYGQAQAGEVRRTLAAFKQKYGLTDRTLLVKSLVLLGGTIFLFITQGWLQLAPSAAALTGAMVLVAISRVDLAEVLVTEVEWPTLIFFAGLFVVVAGAEETGLIHLVAETVRQVAGHSPVAATLAVLWVSAVGSALVDNIPFTATMLPIVAFLNQTTPGVESGVLWWSLALGACLGGNATLIGASANVVTAGMAAKAGYPITFGAYLKACLLPTLITLGICSGYLLLAY
jgi:Na+/H+ antiporter NhaD/arsenite permease-like protein